MSHRIEDLHPRVQPVCRDVVTRAHDSGLLLIVIFTLRTKEEQDALYTIGRTKPGKIVTNARGGYSYHNYGLAFDFCLLDPSTGRPDWRLSAGYQKVGEIGEALGFQWGGRWLKFPDWDHLQYTFGLSIADLLRGKRPLPEEINGKDR
jgi:peptidoglycan L-alanyl-D-glutamate endopeptidase CwlK